MYGLFARWEGAPYDAAPLFYQGLSEEGARVLTDLSDDVQAIREKLRRLPRFEIQKHGLPLDAVV